VRLRGRFEAAASDAKRSASLAKRRRAARPRGYGPRYLSVVESVMTTMVVPAAVLTSVWILNS